MSISVPIVGFIFVCIIYPHIVKNKPQFYMAFAVVVLTLILEVIADVAGTSVGLVHLLHVIHGVLWIVSFVLLVLASGGLSLHELTGELKNAYEVMRRGEEKPTLVIPKRDNPYANIQPPASPPPAADDRDRSIPFE